MGAVTSDTVTVKLQEALLAEASVAVQITVVLCVVPVLLKLKVEPLAGEQTTLGTSAGDSAVLVKPTHAQQHHTTHHTTHHITHTQHTHTHHCYPLLQDRTSWTLHRCYRQ